MKVSAISVEEFIRKEEVSLRNNRDLSFGPLHAMPPLSLSLTMKSLLWKKKKNNNNMGFDVRLAAILILAE